jgi:hypothetical protein
MISEGSVQSPVPYLSPYFGSRQYSASGRKNVVEKLWYHYFFDIHGIRLYFIANILKEAIKCTS